eukprot:893874-Rhodomonas_salina.1
MSVKTPGRFLCRPFPGPGPSLKWEMSFRKGGLGGQLDDDENLIDNDSGSSSLGADVEIGAEAAGKKGSREDDDDGIYADDGSGSSVESAHRGNYRQVAIEKESDKSNSDDGIYDDDDEESGSSSEKGSQQRGNNDSSDGIYADDDSGSSSTGNRGNRDSDGAGAAAEQDADEDSEDDYENNFSGSETGEEPGNDTQLALSGSKEDTPTAIEAHTGSEGSQIAAGREAGGGAGEEDDVVTKSRSPNATPIAIESDQTTRPSTTKNDDVTVDQVRPGTEAAASSNVTELPGTDQNVETPAKSDTSLQMPASAETSPEIPIASTPLVSVTIATRDAAATPANTASGIDQVEQSQTTGKEQCSAKQVLDSADQGPVESAVESRELLGKGGTQPVVSRAEETDRERTAEQDAIAKRLQEHFLGISEENNRSEVSVTSSHEQEEEETDTEPAPAAPSHDILNGPEDGGSDEELSEEGEQGVFAEAHDATMTEGMDADPADDPTEPTTPSVVVTVKPTPSSADGIVYVETEEARKILGLDSAAATAKEPSAGASGGRAANSEGGEKGSARTPNSSGKMPGVRRPGSSWVEYRTRVNPEVSRGSSARRGTRKKGAGRRGRED